MAQPNGGPGNRKAAAWDAIGAAYWNSGYRGGPTERDIDRYLEGAGAGDRIAIVGASTRHLVGAAIDRGADLTVLDFSPGMCAALERDLPGGRCRIVRHDLTTPVPAWLEGRFRLVLADRLVNRFVEEELRAALREMLRLVADGGEIRTSIRLGLYQRDLPLIEEGRRLGVVDSFFDESSWVIDYGAAGDLLDRVLPPHGDIPRDVLLTFYRLRGAEKRLRAADVERYVAETGAGARGLCISEVRAFADAAEDSLYVLTPSAVTAAAAGVDRKDVENLLHPFTNAADHEERGPLVMSRGDGVTVFDDEGRGYIEGIAGLWCTSLGFSERELVDAAAAQMRRLPAYHLGMHRTTPAVAELAERLVSIAPGRFSKAFFTSSGSEANETQIKLLWYYNNAIGRPRKKTLISRLHGYHGVTLGAGSLTGLPDFHRDFDLPVAPVRFLTCPHFYRYGEPGETEAQFCARLAAELEDTILREGPDTVAAFIAEPVMGAGGVIVPPEGYFAAVQAVLRRYDVRFVCDEVICGFGRTGRMWGAQTFAIDAHSISCAKGLSSAYMPIGAVLIDEPVYEAVVEQSRRLGTFAHGFTFGGHPTAAAVALRTLELMEERDVVGHVARVGPRFQAHLRSLADHPLVGEARGVGLLGGVELVADRPSRRPFERSLKVGARCAAFAMGNGLIVRPLGDTLAFCPPLVIAESEVDEMFHRFRRALDQTADWLTRERVALS